jgi:hypothetical protein
LREVQPTFSARTDQPSDVHRGPCNSPETGRVGAWSEYYLVRMNMLVSWRLIMK